MADLKRLFRRAMTFVALLGLVVAQPVAAQQGGEPPREARFAFVIGNDGYDGAPLATAANDAALVADTLKTAGFDVTGARNLDQETLRASYREFLEKVAAAGEGAVAAIYLSGYGVQSEGENYLIPPGARVAREADLALNAVRISDMTRGLGGLPARARIIMLDLAHAGPFVREGQPLAPGLALVEPEEGTLIAFNAAPGSVAPVAKPPYGPYAQALAEMMREAGLPVNDVFARVRTRVAELTKGAQAPWHVSRAPDDLILLERGPDAPPPAVTSADLQARRTAPLNQMGPAEAYAAAVARDTIAGYEAFLAAHPQSPYARNVRNMLAARREAVTWRRTASVNTPNAYWSYLQRYPKGPHAADARRRLSRLQAALEPPPSFDVVDYDVAPPSEEEIVYFNDSSPGFVAFEAPIDEYVPPPPRWWRPPPPPVFEEDEYYFLPAPVEVVETPVWVSRPRYIAAPPPPEWRERPREGVRVNPYVAIPAALAAGIVAGKIISDRRDRNRRPDAGPGRPPRQPFLPPVSATASDLRAFDRRGPQGGPGQQNQFQGRPGPVFQGGQQQPGRQLPGQTFQGGQQQQPGRALPGQTFQGGQQNQFRGQQNQLPGQPGQPGQLGQPGQRPDPSRMSPQERARAQQELRQQQIQQRQQQMQDRREQQQLQLRERQQQQQQQREQQLQQQRQQQLQQQREQQRPRGPDLQQQQRQRMMEQQQNQQQQQRQRLMEQQRDRQQQMQEQRGRQMQQQREQQIQQQRQQQQQIQQQRQQQMQQMQQQRQQQMQQQQQRQQQMQQMQQQRQQQMQMQQQRQQQMMQQRQQQQPQRGQACGRPGLPPCR